MMRVEQVVDLTCLRDVVPICLRQRPQWVCWKYVQRDDKPTKCPVNPLTGQLADSTDSSTWATFEQATAACQRNAHLAGVGFVFTDSDPFCGVDLDDCIDPATGQLKFWGREMVTRLASYTEISPSGNGVKVFLRAKKPGSRCRKPHADGEVEIYDTNRFFTVTGRRLPESPGDVEDRQAELEAVYRQVFEENDDDDVAGVPSPILPKPSGNGHVVALLTDNDIVRLASKQRRTGDKFATLWSGHWNDYFNSPSEADSSVVFTLAYYSKDAAQLDRLFRQSGLMRPKWDEKHGEGTYGQMTVAKALKKVTWQYEPRNGSGENGRQTKAPRPAAPVPINPDLPGIIVDDMQLSDLTAKALDAIDHSNDPPAVFVRSGTPSRVVRDEKGIPAIEPFDRLRMRCRLTEVANFFSLRKGKDGYERVGINPPLSLAENILALGAWTFPPLSGIVRSPILRPDGTICTQPGYDPASQLIYCPDPGMTLLPIIEEPCTDEIQACIDRLLEVIHDFPFTDDASRANALAILFSILMRPVISGHIPLAIIDAPVQGTGKTLLVTTLATIAIGSVAAESIPSKQNEDEWRKKLTSLLLAASPFILLDNIPDNTTINSPSLAAVLTSHEWSDRLLGSNSTIRLPSRAVWAATGNNLRLAGDMPRRSYSIRLDANQERPWERKGFEKPKLFEFVQQNRGVLLSDALTVIRGWYTNKCPRATVATLGSFQEWADTVGSVLAFVRIPGFLDNLKHTQVIQDEETEQWAAFFEAWWDRFQSKEVTADDLARLILPQKDNPNAPPPLEPLPEPFLVNRDRGEGSLKRSIGHNLSRLTGRIFSQRKLEGAKANSNKHVRRWKLTPPDTQTAL